MKSIKKMKKKVFPFWKKDIENYVELLKLKFMFLKAEKALSELPNIKH